MEEWRKRHNTVDIKDGTNAACAPTVMPAHNALLSKAIDDMIPEIS